MNKKVYYRLWRYINGLRQNNEIVKGYAEMLSLKRTWKHLGYKVTIEKYDSKKGWQSIEKKEQV